MYKIIYNGPADKLRGMIVCADEENGFQYLFKDIGPNKMDIIDTILNYNTPEAYKEADSQLDLSSKQVISTRGHIMLNGPTNSSISTRYGFTIRIFMFGVMHGPLYFKFSHRQPEMLSRPLRKAFVSKDGSRSLTFLYAMFGNAMEAHVKVKVAEVNSGFNLCGVKVARTSKIPDLAYSRILFFREQGDKIKVKLGEENNIPLSRPFVAVPVESDLIVGVNLFSDDNVNMIEDTLTFVATRDRTNSEPECRLITCHNCVIKVEVSWRSTRKPREPLEEEESEESTS